VKRFYYQRLWTVESELNWTIETDRLGFGKTPKFRHQLSLGLCPTKQEQNKTRMVIDISTLLSIDQHSAGRKRPERMHEERLSFWIRKRWQSCRGRVWGA
jgi:hypothetical protein